jgi:predicted HicB family RNase H-like nuclease
VRTTSQVHRRLAVEAAEAKVSLNRYINAKLVNA